MPPPKPAKPRRLLYLTLPGCWGALIVGILVAGLAYLVVTGLLLQGFVNVLNNAYSLRDTTTAEGVHPPATGLRSGGPGSVVPGTRWVTRAAISPARGPPRPISRPTCS